MNQRPQPATSLSGILWGGLAFFAVLFLFDGFFNKQFGPDNKEEETEKPVSVPSSTTEPHKPTPATTKDKTVIDVAPKPTQPEPTKPEAPKTEDPSPNQQPEVAETLTELKDKTRRFTFSSRGASLVSADLLVNDTAGIRGEGYLLLDKFSAKHYPHFGFDINGTDRAFINNHWELQQQTDQSLTYALNVGDYKVSKIFTFSGPYTMDVTVQVEGGKETDITLYGAGGLVNDGGHVEQYLIYGNFIGRKTSGRLVYKEISLGDLSDRREDTGGFVSHRDAEFGTGALSLAWVGIKNKYFTVQLESQAKENIGYLMAIHDDKDLSHEGVLTALSRKHQGPQTVFKTRAYIGPKHKGSLEQVEEGLNQVIPASGVFSAVYRPVQTVMLMVLELVYEMLGSYGVAIIILTLLVRLCIHPISRKGQKMMYVNQQKMQKLQPKLEALKKKHANDSRAYAKAQMQLMQENDFNPAKMFLGCLPMFLQLPIFLSLFYMIQENIELRGVGFLWIEDLSLQDALFEIPFPFIVDYFNILPLMTVCVTVIQMKRSMKRSQAQLATASAEQKMQMEMQRKMMTYFVPGFMLLCTYTFPSGVLIYWFTSAFVGIIEHESIRRSFTPET